MKMLKKVVAVSALSSVAFYVNAASLMEKISEWEAQAGAFGNFVMALAFLGGVILAFQSLTGIKKYADNSQQNPIVKPLIYGVVGAFLMGFTAWNTFLSDTVVGDDAGANSAGELTFD